jgi:hypothetical protein
MGDSLFFTEMATNFEISFKKSDNALPTGFEKIGQTGWTRKRWPAATREELRGGEGSGHRGRQKLARGKAGWLIRRLIHWSIEIPSAILQSWDGILSFASSFGLI